MAHERGGRRTQPASIYDVAALAGVSITTVSHTLSGKRRVSPESEARVRRAVDQLGYVPASFARNLQSGSTHVVALLVPDIRNDFYALIAKGAEDLAHQSGYGLILCNTSSDPVREESYLDLIRSRFIDGMVYAAGSHPTQLRLDSLRGRFPVVFADETFYGVSDVTSVTADHYAGGVLAGRHLAELGHTRAVMLTGPGNLVSSLERSQGFEDAFPGRIVRRAGAFDAASGRALIAELIASPEGLDGATAVFAGNDLMALGVLTALREAGLRCPDDLSVVGFDDVREAGYTDPRLTTVRQPAYEIGRQAMTHLIGEISTHDRRPHVAQLDRLAVELVVRGSTAESATAAR
ncbi:LacI family DNA-binding transcriptional regulator [Agromyces sp. NBRC 114283]|uniref:LacI family DNA-binding transcriptional regulator n=1 Tax=Agromyces sp. NBRC 114283 TaxID=2994521 RepID=UPI0024A0F303|nr:LacI family DNA-binding transcriptional regulator [Agromyces sp. NBRC 114283]GLU89708.1 LacI family transcriptional regulator [Agromyces sp. NBRC 114283]